MRNFVRSSLSLVLLFSLSAAVRADTFRCGDQVVIDGDRKSVVIQKCGQPHWKEALKKVRKGTVVTAGSPERSTRKTALPKGTIAREKWFYDCGRDTFVTALTFEGNTLRRIEPVRQGTGQFRCPGITPERSSKAVHNRNEGSRKASSAQ